MKGFCIKPQELPKQRLMPNAVADSFCAHGSKDLLQESASKHVAMLRFWLIADERGSIYTPIMEIGCQNHNGDGLLGSIWHNGSVYEYGS